MGHPLTGQTFQEDGKSNTNKKTLTQRKGRAPLITWSHHVTTCHPSHDQVMSGVRAGSGGGESPTMTMTMTTRTCLYEVVLRRARPKNSARPLKRWANWQTASQANYPIANDETALTSNSWKFGQGSKYQKRNTPLSTDTNGGRRRH